MDLYGALTVDKSVVMVRCPPGGVAYESEGIEAQKRKWACMSFIHHQLPINSKAVSAWKIQ